MTNRSQWDDFYLNFDDVEIAIEVEFEISPYFPANYESPAEGGEVEILTTRLKSTGWDIVISDADNDRIIDEIAARDDYGSDDRDWDAERDADIDYRLCGDRD